MELIRRQRGLRLLVLPLFYISLILFAGSRVQASEADALAIDKNIQARHFPFGTILDPIFTASDSNQITAYTRCGDSAIWTGHYLAAEAFRYKVTGSSDALNNVKAAIAGIKSLIDVTGTDLLARCLVPLNSPYAQSITQEEQSNGIYTNSAVGDYWVGSTSRDQYSGVFFGLGVAYDMVADAGVQSSVSTLVTRMLNFLIGHAWVVVMPDGTPSTTFIGRADQQLSFLQVGQHVNPGQFSSTYTTYEILLSVTTLAPIGVDVLSNDSYFKFNLDEINLYNLIRLEGNGLAGLIYQQAYSILWNHVKDQQNAFFNMIDRALNGRDTTRDAATITMLNQWLARPKRDFYVDLRGKLPSCNSPDEACSPVPVNERPPTDFLWQRDPFQLDGGGTGLIESAGIDYILPFWMARFYGIANSDSVVSAASGSTTVAPESIATFYGANLSSATAGAASVNLPTLLGGVSVTVLDSAGVARPAPLFYVSPTQINFEIPAGTATGQAAVNVVSATNQTLASSTANGQTVAPGIFSADGTGAGVAAALMTTVVIGGQQFVTPVFACSGMTCQAVPIVLGIDTPIFLSLYGTGIRNRSSLNNVSVTLNGTPAEVQYAGPQGVYDGLDQVNFPVSLNLRGAGQVQIVLTVDGQASNPVNVIVQ